MQNEELGAPPSPPSVPTTEKELQDVEETKDSFIQTDKDDLGILL